MCLCLLLCYIWLFVTFACYLHLLVCYTFLFVRFACLLRFFLLLCDFYLSFLHVFVCCIFVLCLFVALASFIFFVFSSSKILKGISWNQSVLENGCLGANKDIYYIVRTFTANLVNSLLNYPLKDQHIFRVITIWFMESFLHVEMTLRIIGSLTHPTKVCT